MIRQKSFLNDKGTLYLVATPIGNLEDITIRAINILKSVDYIFAEDTRVSANLLAHYDIHTKLGIYHEFNKEKETPILLHLLKEGKKLALISDAGMPVISDPGYMIVKEAIENGYNVVAIPGANAALSALITSGITPQPFTFIGFLDSKQSKRKKQLEEIKSKKETLIFYEAPHRIKETLTDMKEILGNRKMALVREITKKFEENLRGTIEEILEVADEIKGEMVIVLEGSNEVFDFNQISLVEHVNMYIKEGYRTNDAIKKVASDRGLSKQDVYKEYHQI